MAWRTAATTNPTVSGKQCRFLTKRGQCVATFRVTARTQSTKQNKAWNSNTMHISLLSRCTLRKKLWPLLWQTARDCAIHVFVGVLLQKNGFNLSWEVIILISAAVTELVTNRDDKCIVSYRTGSKHNQEPLVVKNNYLFRFLCKKHNCQEILHKPWRWHTKWDLNFDKDTSSCRKNLNLVNLSAQERYFDLRRNWKWCKLNQNHP